MGPTSSCSTSSACSSARRVAGAPHQEPRPARAYARTRDERRPRGCACCTPTSARKRPPRSSGPGPPRWRRRPRARSAAPGTRRRRSAASPSPAPSCARTRRRTSRPCLESVGVVRRAGGRGRRVAGRDGRHRAPLHAARDRAIPGPATVPRSSSRSRRPQAPWVLSLDADERVTPELATEIRDALAAVGAGVDGFAVPRLVPYLGRWWYRGGWWPRPSRPSRAPDARGLGRRRPARSPRGARPRRPACTRPSCTTRTPTSPVTCAASHA